MNIINKHNRWIFPIITLIVVLIFWEVIVQLADIPIYQLPAPSKIFATIIQNLASLIKDTTITFIEAILGFLLANILSIIIAIGFTHSEIFERSFYPYAIALKSIPIIAIAPLLVLWFGYGLLGKIVMAAIISFFPLVVNATLGLKSANQEYIDLMKSLSANKRQILFKLRFHIAIPYIFSALKISSTLSVVGAIIGEMTGAKQGIGFVILMASYNINTPMLFAAIIFASALGIIFFGLMSITESIFFRNYSHIQKKELL